MVLAPDVLGWLGLNRATEHVAPGHADVNPVVGARFQKVERLVAELRGSEFHPYAPPTISSPLGYLLPGKKFTTWLIGPRAEAHASGDMVQAITTFGLPFMRSVPDLRTLRKKMEERVGIEDQLVYRRPVAAYLDGDPQSARELLDRSVAALGVRTEPAADNFRAFAQKLRERRAPNQ